MNNRLSIPNFGTVDVDTVARWNPNYKLTQAEGGSGETVGCIYFKPMYVNQGTCPPTHYIREKEQIARADAFFLATSFMTDETVGPLMVPNIGESVAIGGTKTPNPTHKKRGPKSKAEKAAAAGTANN
jgi:hypothetical protein